ncbi:hypothetical protein [Cerasicoccus maritimus]|uniref:hypothetical protein n=1 Tax=Cerasicoccus maritimus TaxID=490089 RepID=UPI002852BC0B|nr:hypothetical protein [Cerasicoccus maritimus]
MRLLLFAITLFLSFSAVAVPPAHRKHPPVFTTKTIIVGQWHSTALNGDAIGLAVDDVVVEFHPSGDFKATVNMNIGGPSEYHGHYSAKRQKLSLKPETQDLINCHVSFTGHNKMSIVIEEKGVSAAFSRGAAPSSSGSWF